MQFRQEAIKVCPLISEALLVTSPGKGLAGKSHAGHCSSSSPQGSYCCGAAHISLEHPPSSPKGNVGLQNLGICVNGCCNWVPQCSCCRREASNPTGQVKQNLIVRLPCLCRLVYSGQLVVLEDEQQPCVGCSGALLAPMYVDQLPRAGGEAGVWGETLQLNRLALYLQIGRCSLRYPPFREEAALRPRTGPDPLIKRSDSPVFWL
eukprot:12912910-Prorocentrum_lima.AAC.1